MIDQGELFDILNPCIGVCEVNNAGYCRGCLRSRQERFHWNAFTPHQKQLVVNLCEKRRRKLLAAKLQKANEAELAPENEPQIDLFSQVVPEQDVVQEVIGAKAETDTPPPEAPVEPEPIRTENSTATSAKTSSPAEAQQTEIQAAEIQGTQPTQTESKTSKPKRPQSNNQTQFGLFD